MDNSNQVYKDQWKDYCNSKHHGFTMRLSLPWNWNFVICFTFLFLLFNWKQSIENYI